MHTIHLILSLISCIAISSRRRSLLSLCRSIDYWQDNPEPTKEDIDIAKNIIATYLKQKPISKCSNQEDWGLWQTFVEKDKIRYIELIDRGEVYGLATMLTSFMRNSGSIGLIEKGLLNRWGIKQNCAHVNAIYKLVSRAQKYLDEIPSLSTLNLGSRIGNPYLVDIKGKKNSFSLINSQRYVYEFLSLVHLDFESKYNILNIGGGFGGMEFHLIRLLKQSTCVIVDLTQTLIFSFYYLSRQYPEKKISYFTGNGDLGSIIDQNDVIFVPDWAAQKVPENYFDAVINRNALENIYRPNSLGYMGVISKVLKSKGSFFSNNLWQDEPRAIYKSEGHGIFSLLEESGELGNFSDPYFFLDREPKPSEVCSVAFKRL